MTTPIAWLAFAADGSESQMVTLLRDEADAAARDWGWSVTPLYAGLTDAEREAVADGLRCVEYVAAHGEPARADLASSAATLRGLLERTAERREN